LVAVGAEARKVRKGRKARERAREVAAAPVQVESSGVVPAEDFTHFSTMMSAK
jgi:hypothetical protein